MRSAITLAFLAAVGLPGVASSQGKTPPAPRTESDLTIYAGHRFGGELGDVTTDQAWKLTDGAAYSMAADFGLAPDRQWEVFVSRRNSALSASGFSPAANNIGLHITYLHAGGTYFPGGEVGNGVYGVGGLGVTDLTPQQAGLDSEIHFSVNFGAGYMFPITKHVGLRLEARAFVTFLKSSGGALFCGGGCPVQAKGTLLTQGELMAGISARF